MQGHDLKIGDPPPPADRRGAGAHAAPVFLRCTSTPVQAGVARQLVDGLRTETVARENEIVALVPHELTPFDEAARTALTSRDAA